MADPMTPSPEDVERMIERLRANVAAMRRREFFETAAMVEEAADMLAALSAIGGEK